MRRARARQAPAPAQDEAEQSYEAEDDGAGESERTTRAGRPRGGMKVAARIGEGLRTVQREIGRFGEPRPLRQPNGGHVQYNYLSRVVDLPTTQISFSLSDLPPPPASYGQERVVRQKVIDGWLVSQGAERDVGAVAS